MRREGYVPFHAKLFRFPVFFNHQGILTSIDCSSRLSQRAMIEPHIGIAQAVANEPLPVPLTLAVIGASLSEPHTCR